MFGDTITLDNDGEAVVLNLVTEGNFSSQYLKKTATEEHRVLIRHSKESPKGSQQFDRHNVEYTRTTYPTAERPNGVVNQVYAVIRSDANSDGDLSRKMASGLADFLLAPRAQQLIEWQS